MTIRPAFGFAAPIARFLNRFRRREGGAVAIWFAVMALPLAILAFGLIDVNRASVEKRHLQDALDAATLLAARSTSSTTAEIQDIGAAALRAELTGVTDAKLVSSTFTISGTRIVGKATATVTPVIANLWLGGDMNIGATSEVVRTSKNLEVALVLDITLSMKDDKIEDLQEAATKLVDMVVSDVQLPFYSKAALVPFSVGVNMDTYAAAARGPVVGTNTVTAAAWWNHGTDSVITKITKANPGVITTSSNHGLVNGDYVYISGVKGMTQLNGNIYKVAGKAAKTFQLNTLAGAKVNTGSFGDWTSDGTVRKCFSPDCAILVTTAADHGYTDGQLVMFKGVKGMTDLNHTDNNQKVFTVTKRSARTFSLNGTVRSSFPAYTSAGTSYCVIDGCEYVRFVSKDNDIETFQITTCVTERTTPSAERYTEASPGTYPVGRMYRSGGTGCPANKIVPLTTEKQTLKDEIAAFKVTGTTAGQIGTAWGWYMLSPNFASLWPAASQPAAYTAPDTLKVAVIMTDGEFNTTYCDGVSSSISDSIVGTRVKDCKVPTNANLVDGTTQALALCENMKDAGVIVYTVGFALNGNVTAENFINTCASSSDHVFLPSGGVALKDAFAAIGRDILKLRLAK